MLLFQNVLVSTIGLLGLKNWDEEGLKDGSMKTERLRPLLFAIVRDVGSFRNTPPRPNKKKINLSGPAPSVFFVVYLP